MKLYEFYVRNLDEVRQASANLKQFADSPEAEGMLAGFEAELCFKDALDDLADNENFESEMDTSDDPSPDDIDEIIDFFRNGEMTRNALNRLRDELNESFLEWTDNEVDNAWSNADKEDLVRTYILENDWDWDEKIEELLLEAGHEQEEVDAAIQGQLTLKKSSPEYELFETGRDLAEEALNEAAETSVEDEDSNYDAAQEEFSNKFRDDVDQREWLRDIGIYSMSEVPDLFDEAEWPYWTEPDDENDVEDNFSERIARDIANDFYVEFKEYIPNLSIHVSSGHGSGGNRGIDWIFESDGSLTPDHSNDDMVMEIVSPKMSLTDCLDIMPQFFKWAKGHKAYTNDSTGFHMSVSVPSQDRTITDYTKLALFLGDIHVLKEFNRLGNTYCESAMMKIKKRLTTGDIDPEKTLDFMKQGLDRIASELIAPNKGFGKYTSINPKNNYIEFRSAGNEDYEVDVKKLQNTLRRYAQAMYIASDPSRERKEYQKKLYNLLKPTEKVDPETAKKLASFSAGRLSAEGLDEWLSSLKKKLNANKMDRTIAKGDKLVNWIVTDMRRDSIKYINVLAKTKSQAIESVMKWAHDTIHGNTTNYRAAPSGIVSFADMNVTPLKVSERHGIIELRNPDVDTPNWNVPEWNLVNKEDPDPGHDWRIIANDLQGAQQIADSWLRTQGQSIVEYQFNPRNQEARELMSAQSSTTTAPASAIAQQPVVGNSNPRQWILSYNSGPNAGVELTRFSAPYLPPGVSMRNAAIGYAVEWLRNNQFNIPLGDLDLRWTMISDSGQAIPSAVEYSAAIAPSAQPPEQPTSRSLPPRSLYRVKNLRTQYEVRPMPRFASPDEAIQYVKDAFSYFFNENDPCEAFEI